MGERRKRRNAGPGERPIPLEPVDLLAGLAPGVELQADDLPAQLHRGAAGAQPAVTSVTEAGRLLRAGDATIRRLIRTTAIEPSPARARRRRHRERAGVVPRSRTRPGE